MNPSSTPRRVLVLGGTSEIAVAIVRELLTRGPCEIVLAGRDPEGLQSAAHTLREDGCSHVQALTLDAREPEQHGEAIERAFARLCEVDVVLLAVGLLGERGGLPRDIPGALEVLDVNFLGAGSLLLHCAARMRAQGHGTIVVLSSVAAQRPRAGNAVYCASKAGLDSLATGLGDALTPSGVRVMVVRPGFVETRMTRGLPRPPLATTPQQLARVTVRGLEHGAHTVWAPPALRWVMLVLRLLPRPIFRRLGL
ncbi:MAG TPA: SDR family NAD(P)-dependent oxidoreductase [Solirubrobacteraceae bacterium]